MRYKGKDETKTVKEKRTEIKLSNTIVIDEGDGYKMRGYRIESDTCSIVVIDMEHPNYGYFADFMIWYRTIHYPNWSVLKFFNFWEKWEKLENFLKDYPEFKTLFEATDFARDIIKKTLEDRNKIPFSKIGRFDSFLFPKIR